MLKLSNGMLSNLGSYCALAMIYFGKDSEATKYLQYKIDQSPHKEQEEVLADETQVMMMLIDIHNRGGE